MHTSTEAYVKLQKIYKARAEEEGAVFRTLLSKGNAAAMDENKDIVDIFLKNCHALKVLKGKKWGVFDEDRKALGMSCFFLFRTY